jgi:hypothetical protein
VEFTHTSNVIFSRNTVGKQRAAVRTTSGAIKLPPQNPPLPYSLKNLIKVKYEYLSGFAVEPPMILVFNSREDWETGVVSVGKLRAA